MLDGEITENEVELRIVAFYFQFQRFENSKKSTQENIVQSLIRKSFKFIANFVQKWVEWSVFEVIRYINCGDNVQFLSKSVVLLWKNKVWNSL
jgi:hypothetical protein